MPEYVLAYCAQCERLSVHRWVSARIVVFQAYNGGRQTLSECYECVVLGHDQLSHFCRQDEVRV